MSGFRQLTTKLSHGKPLVLGLGILLWSGAILGGFAFLNTYQSTPGNAQVAVADWPAQSQIPTDGAFRALMFVHPQCPCSAASLAELGVLLARAPKLKAFVVFTHPGGVADSWTVDSALFKKAKAIPGVQVFIDRDGKESKLFGVETSGHLCLFDAENHLVFNGGVTGRRGHEGDNAGLDSVVRLVHGRQSTLKKTNVFGCSLN